ncbi:MAG: hotdog fold thioesterase, partial [Chitinophagaceae bacterium]
VRQEMCNGFGIAHGGITYSFANSALAFASNSNGKHALSIETSISHLKPLYPRDVIFAVCEEQSLSKQFGFYEVKVAKETGELVALFKGTVFRKNIEWQ